MSFDANNGHRICAGIVTYNPNAQDIIENVEELSSQVNHIYIVDNGSKNTTFLENISENCIIIQNKDNNGLAVALNQLVSRAEEDGYTDIFLFDQDSTVTEGFADLLLSCAGDDVAIVCPIIKDKNKPDRGDLVKGIVEATRPITSGGLYNINIWSKLHGFCEDYFIELIDYDYDEKCLSAGYKILQQSSAVLLQEGGHAERTNWPCGITRGQGRMQIKFAYRYNYSSNRYYQRYRNYIIFLSKVKGKRKTKDEMMYMKSIIHDIIIERNHCENIRNIIKGIRDGRAFVRKSEEHE